MKSREAFHWRAVISNFSLILFQQRTLQIHRIFMNMVFFFFFCLTYAPIALSVRNSSFPKHSICFSTLHLPMQFPLAQILFIFWPLAVQEQDVSTLLLFWAWGHCDSMFVSTNILIKIMPTLMKFNEEHIFLSKLKINLISWYPFSV